MSFLIFSVAGTKMAVPLLKVKEVVALPELTPVPRMPSSFKGLMNLRGAVHPVVDLRERLGKVSSRDEETTVLVLYNGKHVTGAIVDSVDGIREETESEPAVILNLDEFPLLEEVA